MANFDQKRDYHELFTLWHQALAEPIGLVICTPDPLELRDDLYKVRAAEQDPALAVLEIQMSPFEKGDLVIRHPIRDPDKALLESLQAPLP
jgi:hypothetical protein